MVVRRLQLRGLSALRPSFQLLFTMQHRERRLLWCNEWQNWMKEWHNDVFSDKTLFCMQYSDSSMQVWRLRGDCSFSACIRYRHRCPAPGMRVWAMIGKTTCTSLVRFDGDLNTDRCISDILHPVVMCLSNALYQQDNAKLQVARRILIFFEPQGVQLLP
ncbi:transposable element Tcb1 transposase [Trichonephila clavipes]|nr:transposable element Tcb1 transposase [Trichonephila clavipes]